MTEYIDFGRGFAGFAPRERRHPDSQHQGRYAKHESYAHRDDLPRRRRLGSRSIDSAKSRNELVVAARSRSDASRSARDCERLARRLSADAIRPRAACIVLPASVSVRLASSPRALSCRRASRRSPLVSASALDASPPTRSIVVLAVSIACPALSSAPRALAARGSTWPSTRFASFSIAVSV